MGHPKELRIEDFTYRLPEEKIAGFPAPERDVSKLLIYKDGVISEDIYRNIYAYLPESSLLIFNNTKVIQARLLFKKPSGGAIEIFVLEPHSRYKDVTTAMQERGKVWWKCLVGGAAKWKDGLVLECNSSQPILENKPANGSTGQHVALQATLVERASDSFTIEFNWEPASLTFSEILHVVGTMPLPPYIKRETQQSDKDRYQTIYAKYDGSVAAPTAGLHFTDAIFKSLQRKNIEQNFVTLHVGAGTFMPVKTECMKDHDMHEEFIDVSAHLIEKLISHSHDTFSVGTTSLRTLESIYWMGVKCKIEPTISYESLGIKQWEVYDNLQKHTIEIKDALAALLKWMKDHYLENLIIKTQILIAPGYAFKMVRGLITNFHQPQSTLLLLVAALIGDDWKNVYAYALENQFRFLSYGDGSLLFLK